jgi:uncharacterized phage protein (predicted DNA packaging)
MPLDLSTVKLHLRVSGNDEDSLITLYWNAARESASQYLNRNVFDDTTALAAAILAGDLTAMLTNPAFEAAVLLTTAHLYGNREDVVAGVSVAQLPNGSHALLIPYRVGMGV